MANHTDTSVNGRGLDGQYQGHNGSQHHVPALQTGGQPSSSAGQLPNVDLSFLANYPPDQIAAIGQLFLSGAMRLPPTAAAQQSPIAMPQAQPVVQTGNAQQYQSQVPDLEDGEISDVSVTAEPAQDSSRSRGPTHIQASDPIRKRRSQSPVDQPPSKRSLGSAFYVHQQQQLEGFVRVMYDNGYGFDHLKNHVSLHDELSALYQKLSLPVTSKQSKAQPAPAQPLVAAKALPAESRPLEAKSVPAAAPAKRLNNAPAAQDRQAYLARLQAAKSKKIEATSAPIAPSNPVIINTPAADPPKPAKKGLDAEKKELLRQRLAALKAAQASKQQAELDKAATTVQDVDRFLSTLTPQDTGSPQQGSSTSPSDSRVASPSQSRLPFDNEAAKYQSLVISVSDNEQSESELDDSSVDGETGGVALQQTTNGVHEHLQEPIAQTSSTAKSHIQSSNSEVSGASTPVDLAAKAMQDLGELKRKLAEAEDRKKAKTNGNLPQPERVTSMKAAEGLATVLDQQGTDTPAGISDVDIDRPISTTSMLSHVPTPVTHETQLSAKQSQPADPDSDVDMDSSDFEAMYEAPGTKTETTATALENKMNVGDDDEESDWTGTASELDDDAPPAPADSSHLQPPSHDPLTFPLTSPSRSQDDDSVSDSCSMEISDASEDEDTSDESSVKHQPPAPASHDNNSVAPLHQSAHTDSVSEVLDLATDKQVVQHQSTSFTPYESPLRSLKRFRFHPHLVKNVAEPWKSLTWTHKGESMDVFQPVENVQVCTEHDRLGYHVHLEELQLQRIEYLTDLAWNPGWNDLERGEWSKAMAQAAQEQAQFRDLDHDSLVAQSERIMVKHALAWSEQSLMRSCQELN